MGIDFTMIEGKGPKILNPIRSMKDVDDLISIENVENQVPFLGPILNVCFSVALKHCVNIELYVGVKQRD
jgi:hypothetical protein